MNAQSAWYLHVGDTTEISCSVNLDIYNISNKMNLQLIWTKMRPEENSTKVLPNFQTNQ